MGDAREDGSERLIAGGYFLTKPAKRADWLTPDLVPDRFLTVSRCLAAIVPDMWTWSNDDKEELEKEAARTGITVEKLAAFTSWALDRDADGSFGWPNVFQSLADAEKCHAEFLAPSSDWVVLGIGLPEKHVSTVLVQAGREQDSAQGVYDMLRSGKGLDAGGSVAGYEVLGIGYGEFHSWYCNSLEKEICQEFGIRPNSYGLLDSPADAEKASEYAGRDDVGAEPVAWLPWMIVKYDLGGEN